MTTATHGDPAVAARALGLMDLEAAGDDQFTAPPVVTAMPHVFGGQVLAQGLLAAGRTVAGNRTANSLHAFFLRAGDPAAAICYAVDRVRDGRRFANRSVTASQHGRAIATLTVSFTETDTDTDTDTDQAAPGPAGPLHHQIRSPAWTGPLEVPTLAESAQRWGGLGPVWGGFDALEIRVDPRTPEPVDPTGFLEPAAVTDQIWQRVPFRLPDEPLLHQAFVAYASDVMILAAALVAHGVPVGCEARGASTWHGVSIDHALWFHAPLRADEWMLFQQHSPIAGGGRAFANAQVFTAAGAMIATVAQEGLIFRSTTP